MENPFAAYKGDEAYIFVCYAHADSAVVYPELVWLREQGVNIWYDEGISAGTIWRAEIGEALDKASKVLFYISKNSLASDLECLQQKALPCRRTRLRVLAKVRERTAIDRSR